ncbi:MAG: ABC transporter permease subunit, partial [Verrucomicrobiota bacterium]
MIRFFGQRLLVFLVRWILVAVILLIVIELSYGVLGGSDSHVWEISFSDPILPLGERSGQEGWETVWPMLQNSMVVVGISWAAVLVVGYSWGVLGARLRRFKGDLLMVLPWLVLASVPAFWWVIQIVIYAYFTWERPGFADEIVVDSGPDLMGWWNVAVLALPLAVLGIAVQIHRVSRRIRKEAELPFVRGLYRAGYSNTEIFYEHILRRVKGDLLQLSDATLPLILGGLVFVEAAFRFQGAGRFLVQSLELAYFPGIFVVGLWMAALIG